VRTVSFADWRAIEAAEIARARSGSPREKFVAVDEMLAAIQP
jgi:ferredoxin--NADP+ reductase